MRREERRLPRAGGSRVKCWTCRRNVRIRSASKFTGLYYCRPCLAKAVAEWESSDLEARAGYRPRVIPAEAVWNEPVSPLAVALLSHIVERYERTHPERRPPVEVLDLP